MKILIIGLGSIGQRHLRNIKRIYGAQHQILAYRVRRLQQTFSDDMKIRDGINLEEEFGITVFTELDKALEEKPDIVFITNITAKHMDCALKAAKAGCHLFIEKPLSDSLDGIEELIQVVKEKKLVAFIGYQNRYHVCIQQLKQLLDQRAIGRLIYVDSEFSERLSTMHAYEDYSTTYMAQSEMGGGAILNLQIHDLDCLQWLFGSPYAVYSMSGTNSKLKVDVEDYASSIYQVKNTDGSFIPLYSHTDFLQFPPVHKIKVVGDEGRIEVDLNDASIIYIKNGVIEMQFKYKEFSRNDMFVHELKDFFDCIQNGLDSKIDLIQGLEGLKMALAAKLSAKEQRKVLLEEINEEIFYK